MNKWSVSVPGGCFMLIHATNQTTPFLHATLGKYHYKAKQISLTGIWEKKSNETGIFWKVFWRCAIFLRIQFLTLKNGRPFVFFVLKLRDESMSFWIMWVDLEIFIFSPDSIIAAVSVIFSMSFNFDCYHHVPFCSKLCEY